jgi:hypothetical protein
MKTMMTSKRPRDRSRWGAASGLGVVAIALGLLALGIFTTPSHADSILIQLTGPPVPSGGNWQYTYSVSLTGFSSLNSGSTGGGDVWFPDFAEIYDFAGLVGLPTFNATAVGLASGDFTVTTPNQDLLAEEGIFGSGNTAGVVDVGDPAEVKTDQTGANADNIKLSFTRVLPFTNVLATTLPLGTLTAVSKFKVTTLDTYISTDTMPNGFSGKHSDPVEVPVVPTPQTVVGGLALFAVMGLVKVGRLVGV